MAILIHYVFDKENGSERELHSWRSNIKYNNVAGIMCLSFSPWTIQHWTPYLQRLFSDLGEGHKQRTHILRIWCCGRHLQDLYIVQFCNKFKFQHNKNCISTFDSLSTDSLVRHSKSPTTGSSVWAWRLAMIAGAVALPTNRAKVMKRLSYSWEIKKSSLCLWKKVE